MYQPNGYRLHPLPIDTKHSSGVSSVKSVSAIMHLAVTFAKCASRRFVDLPVPQTGHQVSCHVNSEIPRHPSDVQMSRFLFGINLTGYQMDKGVAAAADAAVMCIA